MHLGLRKRAHAAEVDHLDVKPSTAVRHLVEMATVANDRLALRDSEVGWPLEELWVGGELLELPSTLKPEAWCWSLIFLRKNFRG